MYLSSFWLCIQSMCGSYPLPPNPPRFLHRLYNLKFRAERAVVAAGHLTAPGARVESPGDALVLLDLLVVVDVVSHFCSRSKSSSFIGGTKLITTPTIDSFCLSRRNPLIAMSWYVARFEISCNALRVSILGFDGVMVCLA